MRGSNWNHWPDKLTAGSFAPLITHLVEQKKISRDEIERIRAILDGRKTRENKHD